MESSTCLSMERVFFRLHCKIVHSITQIASPRHLEWMERVVLLQSVVAVCTLVWLHVNFVSSDARSSWNSCVAETIQHGLHDEGMDHAPSVIHLLVDGVHSFDFSKQRGFLLLPSDLKRKHNIQQLNVSLSDSTTECMGGPLTKWLLDSVVGYDTVVLNAFVQVVGVEGFVHSGESSTMHNLAAFVGPVDTHESLFVFKLGVVMTTVFLFFITTTLVHHTLRETQQRMLQFTFELQEHVRQGIPYGSLLMNHIVGSLVFVPIMVGMLFFLFEFFNDQLLAFMIQIVVWWCEMYSVVALRTRPSIHFFPRLFFLYFAAFHIYFFSFPSGFSHFALVTVCLMILHVMLFLWNRFEIPALLSGRVCEESLRYVAFPVSPVDQTPEPPTTPETAPPRPRAPSRTISSNSSIESPLRGTSASLRIHHQLDVGERSFVLPSMQPIVRSSSERTLLNMARLTYQSASVEFSRQRSQDDFGIHQRTSFEIGDA